MCHLATSVDTWCVAGKKAGKQPTLSAFLVQPASKGKAGSSQLSKGKAASGKVFLNEHNLEKQRLCRRKGFAHGVTAIDLFSITLGTAVQQLQLLLV